MRSQSYSWILWCYTWISLYFIHTSAWWWPCKAETWSTIWHKKLPKLSCDWWFFHFPITSRNCLNRKYKCWWLVHILLKDGYKISKQGLETLCHVCKWKYLLCTTCQYMPSDKTEYYVCVCDHSQTTSWTADCMKTLYEAKREENVGGSSSCSTVQQLYKLTVKEAGRLSNEVFCQHP